MTLQIVDSPGRFDSRALFGIMRNSATTNETTAGCCRTINFWEDFFFLEKRNIQWLDGLRAIAILLVISRHVFDRPFAKLYGTQAIESSHSMLNIIVSYGWAGVSLFFIISGFLVGGGVVLTIKKGQFNWRNFFIGRIFRIFIPAAVLMLIYCRISNCGGTSKTITHNFLLITNYTSDEWLPHFWSLCVEEHFYIIAPLCGILASKAIKEHCLRRLWQEFLLIGILLSAIRLILPHFIEISPRDYYVQSHFQLDFFMVGIALRLYKEQNSKQSQATIAKEMFFWVSLVMGYVFIATYSLAARGNSMLASISSGIYECQVLTLTLILMGSLFFAYRFKVITKILSYRWLRMIAAISFSTYLTHIPIIEMNAAIFLSVGRILEPFPDFCLVLMLIIGILGSLVSGLIFYTLIERPVLILRSHILRYISVSAIANR